LAEQLGVPLSIVNVIRNMYVNAAGIVCIKDSKCKFNTNIGVKQGDGTSPELFGLYFD
jgi:hypothetical protein